MSRLKTIIQNLPTFWNEKDMIIYVVALASLVFLSFLGGSKLVLSYQNAQETQQQIASMNNFLAEWTEKTNILNHAEYRPVHVDQVDSVQTNLLLGLQANQLELVGFKAISSSKKDQSSRPFELEFTGSYEITMHFLESFHAKDALISIQNIKMEPSKGKIKTIMQYKIYVK